MFDSSAVFEFEFFFCLTPLLLAVCGIHTPSIPDLCVDSFEFLFRYVDIHVSYIGNSNQFNIGQCGDNDVFIVRPDQFSRLRFRQRCWYWRHKQYFML